MANRLILHIGTHKTGTSSLQSLFSHNRDILTDQGVLYPRTDREPSPNKFKQAFFGRTMLQGRAAFEAVYADLKAEFDESGCHTMLISEEGLSGPGMSSHLAPLEVMTRDFDIEAVCFLRRQDYFAESFWNQRCKSGKETKPISKFVALPRRMAYMNYLDNLDRWSSIAKVKAIGFESAREVGIEASFAQATGIDLPPVTATRNISPGMNLAAMLAMMNRQGNVPPWEELQPLLPGEPVKYALGSKLRAQILTDFAEHNVRLRERYGVVFPEDMPEEGEEPIPLPRQKEVARLRAAHAEAMAAIADAAKTPKSDKPRNRQAAGAADTKAKAG